MLASFHSWWTLALLLIFIAIVLWAWSARRSKDFQEAANIPFEDDDLDALSSKDIRPCK